MTRQSNTSTPGKHGTNLASRFRFSAVEALLAAMERKPETFPGKKIRFRTPEQEQSPGCPCCDRDMKVYRRPLGDEWACCPHCGYANDVPGLVAMSLRCSLPDAVAFLIYQHNLHHVSDKEIVQYLTHRARYDRFAACLQERLFLNYSLCSRYPEHGLNVIALERLLEKLDLRPWIGEEPDNEAGVSPWAKHLDPYHEHQASESDPRHTDVPHVLRLPSQYYTDFYGFAADYAVESWFYPKLYDANTGTYKPNTSPHRLFRGYGWNYVLVIPLQDVPGHYCGVICIGRDGEYPDDYVMRLLPDYDTRTTNTGFILPFRVYQSILKHAERGNGHLIACNNPLHYIRTILNNSAYAATPPLVGWIDHFEKAPHLETTDWSPFRTIKNKVFWLQRYDNKAMRTVIEQDGNVVLYDMRHDYPGVEAPPICTAPFRPCFRTLLKMPVDARHWSHSLADRFDMLEPHDAIAELERIALSKNRFDLYLAQLPSTDTITEMRQIANIEMQSSHIRVGQYELFEEAAGLFRKTTRQLTPVFVTDLRCHIDSVFYNSRSARKIYRGRVLYNGKQLAFDLPVAEFEKNAIGAVTSVVKKHDMPDPTFRCKNRFYKMVVFAMSRMKGVRPVSNIGWHRKTCSIDLPQFRIMKQSGIVPTVERAKLLPNDFPAKYLEPPRQTLACHVPMPPDDPTLADMAVPFCTHLSLISLQYVFGNEPRPMIVGGGDWDTLQHIAESLGIPTMPLQNEENLTPIRRYTQTHRWPLLVSCLQDSALKLLQRLKRDERRPIVFYVTDTNQAKRLAAMFEHDALLLLPKLKKQRPSWWHARLPILKHIFFDRLRHHVQGNTTFKSAPSFLASENLQWLNQLAEMTTNQTVPTSETIIDKLTSV